MRYLLTLSFLVGLNYGCSLDPMQEDAKEVASLMCEWQTWIHNPDISKMHHAMALQKQAESISAKYNNTPDKDKFNQMVGDEMMKCIGEKGR